MTAENHTVLSVNDRYPAGVSVTMETIEGWKRKDSMCSRLKKQIEHVLTHP